MYYFLTYKYMDRIIKFDDLKKVVEEAYEAQKNNAAGQPDPLVADMNAGEFGISVRLTDGRKFDLGHTQSGFAIGGGIERVPISLQLLQQMPVDDIMEQMGMKCCKCGCKADKVAKPHPAHLHAHGVRAMSLVEPVGDSDGKMAILSDLMTGLMGTSPVLDDALYQKSTKDNADNKVINLLAENGFELYDSAEISVDLFTRIHSMLATTEQLALMGATIAADGVNPETKEVVFDGALSQTLVAMIAAKGPRHMGRPWMILTGVPAVSSYGGGFMTVIPSVGSISAFSPELNEAGVPVKAAMAVKEIVNKLQLSAFASAKVKVE